MRLLFNLATGDDPVLGFTTHWIHELARQTGIYERSNDAEAVVWLFLPMFAFILWEKKRDITNLSE